MPGRGVDVRMLRLVLIVGRYVGHGRSVRTIIYRGLSYRRDDTGRWLDETGRQPDLETCFALAEQERRERKADKSLPAPARGLMSYGGASRARLVQTQKAR